MVKVYWRKKLLCLMLFFSFMVPLVTATQARAAEVTSGWRPVRSNTGFGYYTPSSVDLTYSPAAVAGSNGEITVFAIQASDHHLLRTTYRQTGPYSYAWTEWDREPLGQYSSSPSALVRADGSMQVFARGYDNRLWTVVYSGGRWSSPQPVRPELALLYAPAAAVATTGEVFVFAVGSPDGHLYRTSYNPFTGVWSAWNQEPADVFTSAPSVVMTGSNYFVIYARKSDYRLYRAGLDNTLSWRSAELADGSALLADAPAGTLPPNSLGRDFPIDVFIQGRDNHLWYPQDGGDRHFIQEQYGLINSAPAAVGIPTGRIEVFAIGTDYHLWQITFGESPVPG